MVLWWEHISLFDPVYPILLLSFQRRKINGGGDLKTTSVSQERSRDWSELSHLTSPKKNPRNSTQEAKRGPTSLEVDKGTPNIITDKELSQLRVRNIITARRAVLTQGRSQVFRFSL